MKYRQNDFEFLGFKFESQRPVPIDTLITNLAETAYVVGTLYFQFSHSPTRFLPALLASLGSGITHPMVVSNRPSIWFETFLKRLIVSRTVSSNEYSGF